jgi:hypothetical protein
VGNHIWEGGHNLLFGGQVGALLEVKVTNGAGEGKIAVDTAKVDKATSRNYARFFT